ncbi:MAG: hypothetical protein J2P25_07335 [Nocardiopsaceae bacterium]|nr:hypothetical protein [Nocardiopsaceae bacterium]
MWAEHGTVSAVKLALSASPSGQKPTFSFGCGKDDGTASCTLGAVDSTSSKRQMEARVTVSKTATSVKSVRLTLTGMGSNVTKKPTVSVPIAITAPSTSPSPSGSPSPSHSHPGSGSGSGSGARTPAPEPAGAGPVPGGGLPAGPIPGGGLPGGATSTLPAGGFPFPNGGPTLRPGGNASSLFPTLNPSAGANPPQPTGHGSSRARTVADTLPADASVAGAQYAGLGALALAFILAVTRLSIRRRQTPKPDASSSN